MESRNVITGMVLFGGKSGAKVSGANIYLETNNDHEPVAFQQTGESGKITFAHLDKGVYRILIDLPQQKGKLEAREPWLGDMKVGYHSEKKMYLFQEETGFFSVRFTKLHNLANKNITPMYEVDNMWQKRRIVIGKVEVEHKSGSISLELSAYTQYRFHKMTDKYKNDAGMSIVRKTQ